MSQFRKVKLKVLKQAELIFGKKERRHNRKKRDFIESIFQGQKATNDREVAMEIITYTIVRLRQLHKDIGPNDFASTLFQDE